MEYRLKLRNEKQAYWIYKIGMGQNTDDGILGEELGIKKWSQMARDKMIVVDDQYLQYAIDKLDVYADIADDNREMSDKWTILRLRDKLIALKK